MPVLITGASGFVGAALADALSPHMPIRATYRHTPSPQTTHEAFVIGELSGSCDWREALRDVTAVVHLAGPAHARFTDDALRTGIVDATARLAEQAKQAGVARFIYVSSVKAAVARTGGAAVNERAAPSPDDPYGRAKLEAEQAVIARASMHPVVLRPPLVHAPGAKANFAALMALARSPAPLPLNGLANRRSIIARTSLIAAIEAVLARADGPSGVFYVADRPALSSAEIAAALRAGLGRKPNLAPALFGPLTPRALRESLEIDDTAFRDAYGYCAADTDARANLRRTAAAWRAGV